MYRRLTRGTPGAKLLGEGSPVERTQIGIVGAGPAGLVLSHLLAQAGVESFVIEKHSRDYIEHRVRAGLLEHRTVELLRERGLAERMLELGQPHRGTELRFDGRRHRIPYSDLYDGRTMLVYPQQELVADLVRVRLASGRPIAFESDDVTLHDFETDSPTIRYLEAGEQRELQCDFVAGCDGFHGVSRQSIPPGRLTQFDFDLPFAWLGIIAAVPPSTSEIIYALHERGFAGHMLRTSEISRFYLQVEPDDDIANWPDDRIWFELRTRLATSDGWTLKEGPILEKSITGMRSYIAEPMRHGRLFLAGDAAHIVPPSGAKGMNLAISDARVLAEALTAWYRDGNDALMAAYSSTCLRRVWRVQEFSNWMSWMIHNIPDHVPDAPFRRRLQRAQLEYVTSSPAGGAMFAENYVGLESV